MTDQQPGFYITSGKGFHVTFANGWTVSVQFGGGNYCEHHDCEIGRNDQCSLGEGTCGNVGSRNAEVAVWGPDGGMIDLGGDTVRGWQSPAAVLALLNAAAGGELPQSVGSRTSRMSCLRAWIRQVPPEQRI